MLSRPRFALFARPARSPKINDRMTPVTAFHGSFRTKHYPRNPETPTRDRCRFHCLRPSAAAFQLMREKTRHPAATVSAIKREIPSRSCCSTSSFSNWRLPTPTRLQSGQFSMALSAHFQRIFLDSISICNKQQQLVSASYCPRFVSLASCSSRSSTPLMSSLRALQCAIRSYAVLRGGTTKDSTTS